MMAPRVTTIVTDQPTFAVLIANWNGEAFIERCLGSVLAAVRRLSAKISNTMPEGAGHSRQEWPTIEVVVTDDASVDRSPELIEANFPGVRLIRIEKNIGFAAAVNLGMKALSADWVFLLNNDLARPGYDYRQEHEHGKNWRRVWA